MKKIKNKTSWEEQYQKLWVKNPSKQKDLQKFIADNFVLKKEAEKIIKCKNCYGKGYSTRIADLVGYPDFFGDKGFVKEGKLFIKICDCERGRDLKKYFYIKKKYK